jgi:hypothetical protein
MAALLTSAADDKDKMALYLADCRWLGIRALSPDVNGSVTGHRGGRHGAVRPEGGLQRRRVGDWPGRRAGACPAHRGTRSASEAARRW